jgi:hypothetical protein
MCIKVLPSRGLLVFQVIMEIIFKVDKYDDGKFMHDKLCEYFHQRMS